MPLFHRKEVMRSPITLDTTKERISAIQGWKYPVIYNDISNPGLTRPNGQTVDELFIEKINNILKQYSFNFENIIRRFGKINKLIMREFLNLNNEIQLSKAHINLIDACEDGIEHIVLSVVKNNNGIFTSTDIQTIRQHIADQAEEQIIEGSEPHGDRPSINALLLLDGIDQERVIRIDSQEKVSLPNRLDSPTPLKPRQVKEYGLQPIIDLIKKTKDKKLLSRIFDDKIAERFRRIGLDNTALEQYKSRLIDRLIHETTFDLLEGEALLCRGNYILHTRRGKESKGGYGIWGGEYLFRALAEYEKNGENGAVFLAELMLEKGQHFMTKNKRAPHGLLQLNSDGTTNINDVVEHSQAFDDALSRLAEEVVAAREALQEEQLRATYEDIKKRAKRQRKLKTNRRFRNAQEMLLAQIEDILDRYDYDEAHRDEINKAVFMAMYELDDRTYTSRHSKIYADTRFWNKNIPPSKYPKARPLKDIIDAFLPAIFKRSYVTHADINELRETMAVSLGYFFNIITSETACNMLLHDYIDKEMVVRVLADGTVIIPSRVDTPLVLTEDMIDTYGLRELVDYVRAMTADNPENREAFARVFKARIKERFSKDAQWSDERIHDEVETVLIDKLLQESSIDIVLGRATLARGYVYANTRGGVTYPHRKSGMWIGEFMLNTFMNKRISQLMVEQFGRTSDDFFRETLLEESQHMRDINKERTHGRLEYDPKKDTDNEHEVIWHSDEWTKIFAMLVNDALADYAKEMGLEDLRIIGEDPGLKTYMPGLNVPDEILRTLLIDAFHESTAASRASRIRTASQLQTMKEGGQRFLDKAAHDNVKVLFLIDPALPLSVRDAVEAEVEFLHDEKGYKNVSWTDSATYSSAEHGLHFAFFIGNDVANIPAGLQEKDDKAIVICSNTKDPGYLKQLFAVFFRIVRLQLMDKCISNENAFIAPDRIFYIQHIFPNAHSLSEETIGLLENMAC